MKSDDNIEKFFEKRLNDSAGVEEDWNVPSDDIWNSAKVHFPKKKKKNRPFFYFLFGAGTMLMVALSVNYFFFTENEKDRIVETAVAPIILNEDNNNEVNKEIDFISNETTEPITETISEKEKNISTISSTSAVKKEPIKAKTNSIQTPEQKALSTTSLTKNQNHFLTENTTLRKLKNLQTIAAESPNIFNENKIETVESSLADTNEESTSTSTFNAINLPTLVGAIENKKRPISNKSDIIKIKPKRKINRWEVGLSHSPIILLQLLKAQSKNADEIELNAKFRNLNGLISRRLSKRISVTSGLMLSSLDFDLDFEFEDVYDMNEVDIDFKRKLKDKPSGGTLSNIDFDIVFTPDANLMNGDSVSVNGNLSLKLKGGQLPFLVNYHFGKGRFEGLIHAGGSLGYYGVKIRNLDFDVYKENVLVSEPVNFDTQNDTFFGLSAFLGAGVKYHLNDRFNIGLSTKFDLTALIFTRYEVGVYYGF